MLFDLLRRYHFVAPGSFFLKHTRRLGRTTFGMHARTCTPGRGCLATAPVATGGPTTTTRPRPDRIGTRFDCAFDCGPPVHVAGPCSRRVLPSTNTTLTLRVLHDFIGTGVTTVLSHDFSAPVSLLHNRVTGRVAPCRHALSTPYWPHKSTSKRLMHDVGSLIACWRRPRSSTTCGT